jgi:hypothetical protein
VIADDVAGGICTGVHVSELGGQFQDGSWGICGHREDWRLKLGATGPGEQEVPGIARVGVLAYLGGEAVGGMSMSTCFGREECHLLLRRSGSRLGRQPWFPAFSIDAELRTQLYCLC